MTARVLRFRSTAHKVVEPLLPWYVNGTLEGEELEYVRLHLSECEECRQDVEWLRELYAACVAAESVSGDSNPLGNFRRLLEGRSTKQDLRTRFGQSWRRSKPWTRWGIAASFVGVAVILAASVLPETGDSALFRTLGASSTTAHASGSLVVVFDPATTEADLRRVLRQAGARVVDGPTQANAYVLDVPAGHQEEATRALRTERAVILVERLGPEKGP